MVYKMVTARFVSVIDKVQTTTIVVKIQAKYKTENEQFRVAPSVHPSTFVWEVGYTRRLIVPYSQLYCCGKAGACLVQFHQCNRQ